MFNHTSAPNPNYQIPAPKPKGEYKVLYFVKCPHCGADIVFRFDCIRWFADGNDELKEASYCCQCCGEVITEQQKYDALLKGKWMDPENSAVHGAINPVLLRHTLFEDVVRAFLDGRKTALGTRVFIECWLIGQ